MYIFIGPAGVNGRPGLIGFIGDRGEAGITGDKGMTIILITINA